LTFFCLPLQKTRSLYADLRRLNVHRCAMCLVLGEGGGSKIDDTLVDKNAILTTKNIISLLKMEYKIAKIGGEYLQLAAAAVPTVRSCACVRG
jgi:hypothetical protein